MFDIAEIEMLWLSHIEIWGHTFNVLISVFFVMFGWIAGMLFILFFAYIVV